MSSAARFQADELPPLLDAAAALGSFAAGLSTEALVLRAGYGDTDAAFAPAHAVIAPVDPAGSGDADLTVWPDWVGTVPTIDSRVEVTTPGDASP